MPDKAKINKFLTEYFGAYQYRPIGRHYYLLLDFFTPDGFFELIKLMKEKEDFFKGNSMVKSFTAYLCDHGLRGSIAYSVSDSKSEDKLFLEWSMINPDTFAPAVAKFLGYEEGDE